MDEPEFNIDVAETEHGLGVFAQSNFTRGDLIGIVTGGHLEDPDHGSDYCIDLGDGISLEPDAPFRFLNHSCEPNCELLVIDSERAGVYPELHVEAIRPISPGEQLTIDYAWPAEQAIECGCRSQRCRGWIVHPQQRHLVSQFSGR